ncbi:transcription termination factor Rho [Leucobacter tardus]|uniref:transcription termination factor Rho n=1 Tax=Leucobacter tardus TaxID=501483 RepID=UPI0027DE4F98|nr:transcription termination factor Rho [Leucobacter tardus]
MEQNSSETTPESTPTADAPAAPRRRASRRVSTAAAAPEAPEASAAEAPTASTAPAASETAASEAAAPEAAAEAPKKRTTRTRKKAADADVPAAASDETSTATEVQAPAETPSAAADAEQAAPKKRTTRTRKKATDAEAAPAADAPVAADGADQNAEQVSNESAAQSAASTGDTETAAPKRTSRSRKSQAAQTAETGDSSAATVQSESGSATDAPAESAPAAQQTESDDASADDAGKGRSNRGGRGKNGKQNSGQNQSQNRDQNRDAKQNDKSAEPSEKAERNEKSGGDKNGTDRNGADRNGAERGDKGGESSRSTRTRQRDRKRRGQGDDFEPEISDDDVLLPVGGILDVLDNYAFVRTSGYLPGTSDVYVSLGQVKKYGLRKGDAVTGSIRQPREGDGNGRQKYNAIVKVDTVNGHSAEEPQSRGEFAELTPLYPEDRVRLETTREQTAPRVIDIVAPIGFGQRALISGPSGSGKSTLIREIAAAVSANHPDAHLMLVATSERPEEVTHLQRTINGEVIASTFDRPTEDHTTVAELAVERAKRLVELGHDVVVLLESVTDVAHAYVDAVPTGGRNATDDPEGVAALQVKRLLAAARNLENAGSLTIIATADTKTGNPADKALVKTLLPVVNSTIRLSGDAAAAWIFPAVDVARTYTERETLLRGDADTAKVQQLRRSLTGASAEDAIRGLVERVESTATNADLIARA